MASVRGRNTPVVFDAVGNSTTDRERILGEIRKDKEQNGHKYDLVINTERISCMFKDSLFKIYHMKNLYGGFDYFPGFFIDLAVRSIFHFLRILFPMNIKLLKGKIMFHPLLFVIGQKARIKGN